MSRDKSEEKVYVDSRLKQNLICRVLLLSHYYLQLNQNVEMLPPCSCIVFAELSTGQI